MPPANTPLYSHPLPDIEAWLIEQGCDRNTENISLWTFSGDSWKAELFLDTDAVTVDYISTDGSQVQRSFKYSLSRGDLQEVIFAGP